MKLMQDASREKLSGSFYTPPQIVDFILDSVGYEGSRSERILDPACGSGTFLVQALKRYLEAKGATPNWGALLDELCDRPRIVGFDINPFAVLMSQIRFMIKLIPFYKRAIDEDKGYILKTLPIFLTDSLQVKIAKRTRGICYSKSDFHSRGTENS
jgi:type I restriction-modification system DNA methylase subunit